MRRHRHLEPTLRRHGAGARAGHAVLALSMLALVVSGLGLAGHLPGPLLTLIGGHARAAWLHRQLGLLFGVSFAGAFLLGPASLRRLVRDLLRFSRAELAWLPGFVRYCTRPSGSSSRPPCCRRRC